MRIRDMRACRLGLGSGVAHAARLRRGHDRARISRASTFWSVSVAGWGIASLHGRVGGGDENDAISIPDRSMRSFAALAHSSRDTICGNVSYMS